MLSKVSMINETYSHAFTNKALKLMSKLDCCILYPGTFQAKLESSKVLT